jgi:hypothetical protein
VSWGLLAEFRTADDLLRATRAVYGDGYRAIDAYSPLPVHGLAEALGFTRTRLPVVVLAGGLTGATLGFLMQVWMSAVDYPIDIGGRPPVSWPSFIVITFEMTVLFAALSAVLGMFALNGLPRPYHPVFHVERFRDHGSRDRFFLAVESRDPRFDPERTRAFLESLGPEGVHDVAP